MTKLTEEQEKSLYEKVDIDVSEYTWSGLRRMDEYDIKTQDEEDEDYVEGEESYEVNQIINGIASNRVKEFNLSKADRETVEENIVDYIYSTMWGN